jgi:GGDEF domain-containing protein
VFVTRIEAENAMRQAQFARQEAARQMQRVKELARRAEQDPLTGLGNRAYFERRVAALGTLARHDDPARVLALLDIDHFKLINDRFGHAAGDHVLVGVAQMLLRCTREADIVARLGGDEFAVIIVGAPQRPPADVFERLRRDIELAVGWTGLPGPALHDGLVARVEAHALTALYGPCMWVSPNRLFSSRRTSGTPSAPGSAR